MEERPRPNPDELLKRIEKEEETTSSKKKRGKLKIYLGAAPGVGKTYMMLVDALDKHNQGIEVVVGVAESHGRKEIENFLKQLEILPRQIVSYKGKELKEFDLDASLARNPEILLIDEMAHTNVPGLRHNKRWQDIKEILDRGIDVYTTLNIQHVESLNNVITQIINISIKETVPDFMLEMADSIELVDLPPEDLLKRLKDGKVYFPKEAALAAENFFRKGNLTALRELALRTTAERVNKQVLSYRENLDIKQIWPTKEKLLACIGPHADSTKILRVTKRLANDLKASWVAVYVVSSVLKPSEENRNNALKNLRFAEQLGAETRVLTGLDIVQEILSFARSQNITKIVMGKQILSRFRSFFHRSLTDEVIRYSSEIDVHVVTGTEKVEPLLTPFSSKGKINKINLKCYSIMFAMMAFATLVNILLSDYLNEMTMVMIYLLVISFVASMGELSASIVASILSVIAMNVLFMNPNIGSEDKGYRFSDLEYLTTLLVMLSVSYLISHLTTLLRTQANNARMAAELTEILHSLSLQLASQRGIDKLLDAGIAYLSKIFDSQILALLPEGQRLKIRPSKSKEKTLSPKEQSVAEWVYNLGQSAGKGTDTLSYSEGFYVPLLASTGTIGVLRILPHKNKKLFSPEEMHLLESSANQIALAIEVDKLQERKRRLEILGEKDRVHNALLDSISHDLRTPIVSIMGNANTLLNMEKIDPKKFKKVASTIYSESEQLNRLIHNLLQMTYLESESVKLEKELISLHNLVSDALQNLETKLSHRLVLIEIPKDLPLVPLDSKLIREVFINLIENAIKFTPDKTDIEISAQGENHSLLISIRDHGPGIVPDEVELLFAKFYRGRKLTSERGMGLGLAICQHIIEVHGGKIWALNHKEGGAIFQFTLPLTEPSQ